MTVSEVFQFIDAGGLFAFAYVVYKQLGRLSDQLIKTLGSMDKKLGNLDKNQALILENVRKDGASNKPSSERGPGSIVSPAIHGSA